MFLLSCSLCLSLSHRSFLKLQSPTFLTSGINFMEDIFSTDWGWFQDDLSTYNSCEFYFYYYYISCTSNHQALNPRVWGLLL